MRVAKPCRYPRCPNTTRDASGYCEQHVQHKPKRKPRTGPSYAKRGYGRGWQKIRENVLKEYGIPRERWHLYAIDHTPAYDARVEPDHEKYQLRPMLIDDHNRKTARQDVERDENGRFMPKS
jgi:5-methylcytosine-specific restriction protein A